MKPAKILFIFLLCILAGFFTPSNAQVKITDGALQTMDPNSLLELESTNKGFLPPRVIINSLTSVAPLTGTVPAGMLVYSSGGTVTDGYYLWNGSKWKPFVTGTGGVNLVTKTANATLTKAETFVAASNNITLTMPLITSADDGLSISINNVGTATDLITIINSGGATTDGLNTTTLTRWMGYNYIASGGNWIIANNVSHSSDLFEVSFSGSWQTIPEILAFLALHMTEASIIKLDGDIYTLTSTQIINLPYPLSIEGLSSGVTTISAASGFTGGLFSCVTACSFKMLTFTSAFGTTDGHDAIRLTGSFPTHYGIKDCGFTGFNKGISTTSNSNVWIFECSFINNVISGVEIAAGTSSGIVLSTSTLIFINCGIGINMLSGTNATLSLQNNHFFCFGGQIGLNYVPATFTATAAMVFTNNTWNYTGSFINGFDFTRADGRDADMCIENNAGIDDKNPNCKINVVNNSSTTTCVTAGIWYKANWTNTTSITTKFLLNNNKITYQSQNTRSIYIIVSGNVSVDAAGRNITIGIVKNGITGTRYGETTLRTVTINQPFQYSTIILLSNVSKNDYFELYVTSSSNGDILTFQDVNIYADSK